MRSLIFLFIILTFLSSELFSQNALGDVNGDGRVSAADALLIARHAAGIQDLSLEAQLLADVDCEEGITMNDAVTICKYEVRLIPYLPYCDNHPPLSKFEDRLDVNSIEKPGSKETLKQPGIKIKL